MNRTACRRPLVFLLALPIACLAMGRCLPARATDKWTPPPLADSTAQLWLGDQLSPPVRLDELHESSVLNALSKLTSYRPTGEEALEEGVVFNLPTESGTFYRYTFYRNGLVACQVNGETLWYQCGRLASPRTGLLAVINSKWEPPAGSVRPVPYEYEFYTGQTRFTGDRDAPVDIEWLKSQIKRFDPEEDWTVLIEPGTYFEPYFPVTVRDEAFRRRILSMVSDLNVISADRRMYSGATNSIWVVKGEERYLYGVSGNMINNYQTLGYVSMFYNDHMLGEDVVYMLTVEQLRLTEESQTK